MWLMTTRTPVALLMLCASLAGPAAAAVTQVRLCDIDSSFMSGFVVSPDARHLAWMEQRDGMGRVVLDGATGSCYDRVSSIVFSEDGDHMAYVVGTIRAPDPRMNYAVVRDGEVGEFYEQVDVPQIDLHGRMLAYFAHTRNEPVTLVVNGSPLRPRDTVVGWSFAHSREGGHFAFLIKRKDLYYLVTDAGLRGSYRSVAPSWLGFSPDGEHLSYVIPYVEPAFFLDEQRFDGYDDVLGPVYDSLDRSLGYALRYQDVWRLTIQRRSRTLQLETTDGVSNLMLSPTGEHFAYLKHSPLGGTTVILDTAPVGAYERVVGLTFSPDGNHLAFAAGERDKWRVVFDGTATGRYDSVRSLVVSPSGGHWACWARKGDKDGKWRCVVDGSKGEAYDAASSRIVFDNEHELHCIARRRNMYYRVSVSLDK